MLPLAFGFGTETYVIIGVLVLLFGVRKLPELGKSLAQGIHEFKKASKEIVEEDADEKQTASSQKSE